MHQIHTDRNRKIRLSMLNQGNELNMNKIMGKIVFQYT